MYTYIYIILFLIFPSSWSGSFYVSACLWILGMKQYLFYLWTRSLFTDCSIPQPWQSHAMYVLFFYSAELHLSLSSPNKVSITSDGVLWKTHILLPLTVIPPPNCSYQVEHSSWLLMFPLPLLNFYLPNQSTLTCRTEVGVCTDGW